MRTGDLSDDALREIKLQIREHFNSRFPNMEVKEIELKSPSWTPKTDLQRYDRLTVVGVLKCKFTLGRDQPIQEAVHVYYFEALESGALVLIGSNI